MRSPVNAALVLLPRPPPRCQPAPFPTPTRVHKRWPRGPWRHCHSVSRCCVSAATAGLRSFSTTSSSSFATSMPARGEQPSSLTSYSLETLQSLLVATTARETEQERFAEQPERIAEAERLLDAITERFTWESVRMLATFWDPLLPALRQCRSPALVRYLGAVNGAVATRGQLVRDDVAAILRLWWFAIDYGGPGAGAALLAASASFERHLDAAGSMYDVMALASVACDADVRRRLRRDPGGGDVGALLSAVYDRLAVELPAAAAPVSPHQFGALVAFARSATVLGMLHGECFGALNRHVRRTLAACQLGSVADAASLAYLFAYMGVAATPLMVTMGAALDEPGGRLSRCPADAAAERGMLKNLVLLCWSFLNADLTPPTSSMLELCERLESFLTEFGPRREAFASAAASKAMPAAREKQLGAEILDALPSQFSFICELLQLLPALPRRIDGLVPMLEMALWARPQAFIARQAGIGESRLLVNEVVSGPVLAVQAFDRRRCTPVAWSERRLPRPVAVTRSAVDAAGCVAVAMLAVDGFHRVVGARGVTTSSGVVRRQRDDLEARGFLVREVPFAVLWAQMDRSPRHLADFFTKEMTASIADAADRQWRKQHQHNKEQMAKMRKARDQAGAHK